MLEDDMSDDEIYKLLSSETRRQTIAYFDQSSERSHSCEEIAGYLAERAEETFDRLTISLHHNHLPKLDSAGLIMYDDENCEVTCMGDIGLEGDQEEGYSLS